MKIKNCQHYSYNNNEYDLEWGDSHYFSENFKIKENRINWLNFHNLSDRIFIEKLCYKHNIDKISISEIFLKNKDNKLEEYDKYISFSLNTEDGSNINFIVGSDFLFTFQEKKSNIFEEVRDRITNKIGKIRSKGVDFLLFRLLHSIIDHYSVSMENISSKIVNLENNMNYEFANNDLLKEIELYKRRIFEVKKRISPIKNIVAQIEKLGFFIESDNIKHFNDLKHHTGDIISDIDDNKQILDGLVNLYYAVQGQKMNEIMKVLTIISTIFIPLTFIAGLYGMNFKFMPELESKWGYPTVIFLMFVITIFLIRWFKNKGWLKK